MNLTKQQLMKVSKRTFVDIDVPELDGKLRLVSFSAGAAIEAQALSKRSAAGEDVNREIFMHVIQSSIADENSELMFAGDAEGAAAFYGKVSLETLAFIVKSVPTGSKHAKAGAAPGEASKETQLAALPSDSPASSVSSTPMSSSTP